MIPGAELIWAALPEARIAGGAVRDHLLGLAVSDVDFAIPLAPAEVMQRLAKAGIKAVPTGIAHGTVTAVLGKTGFEITSLRRDVETDGRHAIIAFTDDWQADAARRDFTINAMSMTQDGRVFDYFRSEQDLRAGIVRFVGSANARIPEDYLRILRFFRFFARYSKTPPDPEALAGIIRFRDGLKQISAERVWNEMTRILAAADPRAAMALMQDTGVLTLIFPEGADLPALNRLVESGAPGHGLLRIAALLKGDADGLAARLKLSGQDHETLRAYKNPNLLRPGASDADLRRALAEEAPQILIARSWLAQAGEPGWDELRTRIGATPRPVFPLRGRDIIGLGIPAGPRVGEILQAIREQWLAQGCETDRSACLEQTEKLIGEEPF